MERLKHRLGFWKTTIIGGVIFLLPLIILGALSGQLVPVVWTIAEALYGFLPLKTPGGIALLVGLAILILLIVCFLVGLAARRSFARRISDFFEKNITMLFPRYTIIKELMKGSLGGEDLKPNMHPVLVSFDDFERVGFEMDRREGQRVAIYLPGAPDAWSGFVVWVSPKQVTPLAIEFNQAFAFSEKLGRDSIELLQQGGATGNDGPESGSPPPGEESVG